MKLAMSKTRERYPLCRRKIMKKLVTSSLLASVFLLLVGAVIITLLLVGDAISGKAAALTTLVIVIILAILNGIAYWYQLWYFAVYYYDLTDDFIVIRKYPITPHEVTIPYERIQDVYVDQDLFDRIFRLYDVHLSSATASSGALAHIDGVEKEVAEGLRAELLRIVQSKISRNRAPSPPVI